MDGRIRESLITQIEAVEAVYDEIAAKSKYDDLSDRQADEIIRIVTLSVSVIERITGKRSSYMEEIKRSLAERPPTNTVNARIAIGVVRALKDDLSAGYIKTLEDLIYGEVFSDLLETASYLLEEGYKDPAAVIAGGALEEHLRKLCKSADIELEITTTSGIRNKKADQMNSDLARSSVYSRLDQKNVTAWLDLRNKAAHALYTEYTKEQVNLMITGVRDFINKTISIE